MDSPSPEFISAPKTAGLEIFFAGCTDSHRREYLKWIGEARKPAIRDSRIKQAIQMLAATQKKQNQFTNNAAPAA